ncbi:MAG TPA: hypothetical protein VL651_04160 [Bacteroidia bacterium]|jgi:hypothetical protein|nr:hypothetical protein [Bacteroidia bacterium]
MRTFLLFFLLLPFLLEGQTQPPFRQDSTLFRKTHVYVSYAFRQNSKKPEEVRFFNRNGLVTIDAILSTENGDTLERYKNAYDSLGELVLVDWFYPEHSKTSHIITWNIYEGKHLFSTRSDWVGDPDSTWSQDRYEYDLQGRAKRIITDQHITYDHEGYSEYRHDTILYSYNADTILTLNNGYQKRKYFQTDSSSKIVAEWIDRFQAFYVDCAYRYDSSGHLSHMEYRRENGDVYWWENYSYDENGLLMRMEIFEAQISKEKPIAVYTYQYDYYK